MKKKNKKRIFANHLKNILSHAIYLGVIGGLIFKAFSPLFELPPGLRKDEFLMYWTHGNEIVRQNFIHFFQLGLWDSSLGLGYPLAGHISTQFYPLTLLFYFVTNIEVITKLSFALHLVGGGMAFYFLMKVLKCDSISSILGSVTFVANTYITGILLSGFPTEIYNLVWTPLSIAFFWLAITKNNKWFSTIGGICMAMNILSMTLYAVYHNVFLILGIFIGLSVSIFFGAKFKSSLKDIVLHFCLLFLVTFGLSAIKLLPVMEYTDYSVRQVLPLYGGLVGKSGVWDLSSYESLFRYLTNVIIPPDSVSNKYVPISFLFFVLILASFIVRKKESYIFLGMTVIFLLATMGKNFFIDIYAIFYYLFPPLQAQYTPNRFFIDTNLTLSVLASLGLSTILTALGKFNKIVANIVGILIVTAIVIPLTLFTHNQMLHLYKNQFSQTKAELNNEVNKSIVSLNNKSNEIIHFASSHKDAFSYSALTNSYRLSNPFHRDYTLIYRDFQFYWERLPVSQIHKKYKLLGLMNTKYMVTDEKMNDYPNAFTTPIKEGDSWGVYQLKKYVPYYSTPSKAILLIGRNNEDKLKSFKAKIIALNEKIDMSTVVVVTTKKEKVGDLTASELAQFDALLLYDVPADNTSYEKQLLEQYISNGGKVLNIFFYSRYFDDIRYKNRSLFTHNPAEILAQESQKELEKLVASWTLRQLQPKIIIKKDTPEQRVVEVDASEKINLRVASSFFPGWEAYIDGYKTKIYMADGMNTVIFIDKPGRHEVTFLYRPKLFYIGALITILTIIVILSWGFLKVKKYL